jgi:hypothetical protein
MKQFINDQKLSAFSYHTAAWKYDKIKSGLKVSDKEVETIVKKYLEILKKKKVIEGFSNSDFNKLLWFTNNMNQQEIVNNLGNQEYSYRNFEKDLDIK